MCTSCFLRKKKTIMIRSRNGPTTRSHVDQQFILGRALGNRLHERMEGRRRSWRRPDGEFRFREQVYDSTSGIEAGDGLGSINETFWDALQTTLDDTRDNEAIPFEPDTKVQIKFKSPNGMMISTKMVPIGKANVRMLCDELLTKALGSNMDLLVVEVALAYIRPAQAAGGGSNGASKLGGDSRLTVYSHGLTGKACGPRALALLLVHKSKDAGVHERTADNQMRKSRAADTGSAAGLARQAVAIGLCSYAGVDIPTDSSFSDSINSRLCYVIVVDSHVVSKSSTQRKTICLCIVTKRF
jgi:hypothetical protein